MKNIFKYSFAALVGILLASCNGDYDDWASPQANSPEEVAAKYGVSFAAGPDANVVMPVDNDEVRLVAISAASDKVAGFAVNKFIVNGEEIEASVNDGFIVASASQLSSLLQSQFNSRASTKRTLEIVSQVSLILNNGDAVTTDVIGNTNASFTAKPTPVIDSKGYFLLGNFEENGSGWDLGSPVWMTDNGDGTYTAIVNTTGEDNWFKFYEGSNYSSSWDEVNLGQMGCAVNGDNARNGFVVFTGDDQGVQTPVISGKGKFEVTLDMVNLTYTVKQLAVNLYIVGGPNDWVASAASKELKFTQPNPDEPFYTITFPGVEDGDCWFAIGDDDACDAITNDNVWKKLFGTTSGNGSQGESGTLTRRTNLSDDGSFCVNNAKFITVTVNLNDMSYTVKAANFATYIYEAGNDNSWGEIEKPFYSANGDGVYEGWFEVRQLSWGIGFKFRGNKYNWDNGDYGAGSWSDAGGTLVNGNAGNLEATPGFYRAVVNLGNMSYSLYKIDVIGIIGDATANGWDGDTDMTYNSDELCWEVVTTLKPGSLKFRANHDWSSDFGNWGGTMDNIINGSNDNIPVDFDGKVKIKFYPLCNTRSYCTITYVD